MGSDGWRGVMGGSGVTGRCVGDGWMGEMGAWGWMGNGVSYDRSEHALKSPVSMI